jgi:hypothetical protein
MQTGYQRQIHFSEFRANWVDRQSVETDFLLLARNLLQSGLLQAVQDLSSH